ncbi:uncharacterized protein LOC135844282 [Planococcus citri]|uniref:uncharacterized protein LOC135844282 n=1 Tax=Planococcus citri TaxID=170843 RepID=UPI0031F7B478
MYYFHYNQFTSICSLRGKCIFCACIFNRNNPSFSRARTSLAMDSNQILKKLLYLLTLHLLLLKNANAAQESANLGYNALDRVKLIDTFESKASQFINNMDKFADWIRDSDPLSSIQPVKDSLLHDLHRIKECFPIRIQYQALAELRSRIRHISNQLYHLKANSKRPEETTKFQDIILQLLNFGVKISHLTFALETEDEIAPFKPILEACIREILAYRFDSARAELQKIHHDRITNIMVEKLHNLGEENFYTLVNFVDYLKNDTDMSFGFWEALHDGTNAVASSQNFFKLYISLLNDRDQNENTTTRKRIESFVDLLKYSIKRAAVEEITDAFVLNYLVKVESYVTELAETRIFDMNNVIESVIDRISQKLGTKHLSGIMRADKGLCVNETTAIPLIFRLKRLLSWSKYCTLSQDVKKLAQRAMNSSPVSIGLGPIEYCQKVCIMNVNFNEYLYDPDKSECLDKHKSNSSCPAYTTNAKHGGKRDQLAWNLKQTGMNKYQIISYNNNYSLFVDDEKLDEERRCVSTRQIGHQDDDKYEWQFESDGDFVYIKNIHYGEYLSASIRGYINNVTTIDLKSMVTTSKRLRNVFTFVHKKLTPDCYWTIVECP